MNYLLKEADTEWRIEPSIAEAWILKQRTTADWSPVGTYKSPTEAAVSVGAKMTASSRTGQRHRNRLKFVLSRWDIIENY
jgi:hypothetical protein